MHLFDRLRGGKLLGIVRVCDLIKCDFSCAETTICIHVQNALFRGRLSDKLIVSSNDMFLPGKHYKKKFLKRFKWDQPGDSLFDEQLLEFNKDVVGLKVDDLRLSGTDLTITLNNGYAIDILACTMQEEEEVYRAFIKGNLDSHIVVET